ncbi:MAG: UDP-2,3-diacylglucosamine diphosphatase [Gemmatimonadota bacterium]
MSEQPALVASDAHLGAAPPEHESAFRAFLRFAGSETRDLVLNGDVFDFWFEYRTVILRRHFRVLSLLSELVDAGVRVRLVGGNHDAWGGAFLREEIGIELLEGPVTTRVGGRRAYLAHGDGLAGGDRRYRWLRRLLRGRVAAAAFRAIHPDRASWIIRRVSKTEARARDGSDPDPERAARLSARAEALLAEDPELQIVIFGHSHEPELREIGRDRHYLNAGDWVRNCTYGVVGPSGVALRQWSRR